MSNKSLTSEERRQVERSLNSPIADADLEFYSKAASWTYEEAAALSFGKNPKTVNWTSIRPLLHDSSFAQDYDRRRQLIKRAINAGQLENPIPPGDFLTWAKHMDIELPEALVSRVDGSGVPLHGRTDRTEAQEAIANNSELAAALEENAELKRQLDEVTSATEKEIGSRERNTLQFMAFVGAAKAYGYDPDRPNNACEGIESDLTEFEHRRSVDTIRNHLKAVAPDLAPDWRKIL